jgi:hypothetical protein
MLCGFLVLSIDGGIVHIALGSDCCPRWAVGGPSSRVIRRRNLYPMSAKEQYETSSTSRYLSYLVPTKVGTYLPESPRMEGARGTGLSNHSRHMFR